MSRKLRFIPDGGAVVEATSRTIQGRLLLRPSPQLNEIVIGVLGRAQRLYPLEILGYVFLGNHYHLLLRVDDAQRLSQFMGYFNGNLAREVARLTGWEDKVWARRYQAILVTDEEEAQANRLKYLLENSCKEGLADSPIHWPGVHCAKALITGDRVEGTWFDRKFEYNARLQGKEPGPREFASTEEVVLSQLSCWRDLAPEATTTSGPSGFCGRRGRRF